MNKEPIWITEAKKSLGLHEVRDNAKLAAYMKAGKYLGDPKKQPWCGDFVETVIVKSLPREPLVGALGQNPFWALNWNNFGVATKPVFGCVVTFVRPGGGHVGFLVGEDATHYYVLGGNQSDAVTISRLVKTRMKATRWPATVPNPGIPLPKMKPGSTKISINEA